VSACIFFYKKLPFNDFICSCMNLVNVLSLKHLLTIVLICDIYDKPEAKAYV